MILAAGKGTRLRPFTDHMPKALFPVKGIPLLEHLIRKMISFDVNEIIINVHHFAEKIIEFLENKKHFGIRIEVSEEGMLLETGGGLKKAQWFFDEDKSFLVHNVDIISQVNFNDLLRVHDANKHKATLAVSERKTSRYLLFDDKLFLKGWQNLQSGEQKLFSSSSLRPLAFSGIQILSPAAFNYFPEEDVFSLTDFYLGICQKTNIGAFLHDEKGWYDVGKMADINPFSLPEKT